MPKKIFPSFIIRFLPVMAILYLFAGLTLSEENISQPEILWRPEGILVNDTPGGSAQKNPKVISSGTSYIAVWEDGRSGFFNIYAQKIGEGADLEWGKDALAVCQAPMNQSLPEIVSDGEDGAIVIWEDYRSGHADIYAQKISGLGTVEWKKDGIPICEAPNAQLRPLAISDGYGGAIITWYDYRGELAEDIYAQRIDNTGRVLWQKDGVPISAEKGTQWYPGIAPDGTGGAVIVWTDFRSGSTSDVYAQRISSSGKIMWEKDGIPVASIAENQLNPDIAYAGAGEVIIAWEDYRAGNFDIYSQKIKITSETVWQKNGIQVGSSVFNEEEPHIVADQAGGAIVVWKERRINGSNILSQKIDKDGLASWGETPKMICKEDGQKSRISISPADRGGALISWEDTRAGNSDIYIQKLSSTGITLWKVGGSPVARISDDQENPQILASGQNGAFVVWQDKRYGNYDIYAQKLESDSSESWIPNGIIVNASIGSVAQKGPVLGRDGDGNYIITWEDGRSGYTDIYAQKLDESGKLLFEQNGVPVCTAEGAQRNPRMLIDGADIFIVWEDFRSSYPQIYIQKLDQDGRPLFESNGLPVSRIELSQVNPQLISDGKKGAIVIFEEQSLRKGSTHPENCSGEKAA
ncbi:MAG: hypothetical protein NT030_01980 [Candidatus Saganbacteria bacterium]|nr:hypothetical protein [Candidatus Saganbacteria bacterium]